MSEAERQWQATGERWGWVMPAAPAWKRLPVIRHLRAVWAKVLIERWYSIGPGSIGIRTGLDDWVVAGIWLGKERPL